MTSKRKKFWGNTPKFKQQKTADAFRNNRFQSLSDLEDDDEPNGTQSVVMKVPPIVVDSSHSFTSVFNLQGENGKYKRMSVGTKVTPNSLTDYESMVTKLKDKGLKFHTHPVRDQKRFKLILFGLHRVSIATILDEFKNSFNIVPLNVAEIKTARSNSDDALYAIEFDRNQISKKEVRRIKYFYNIVVHWKNPLKNSKGPTQCSKCAMFGHGAANCFRKEACLGCGGPHDYSSCQLKKHLLMIKLFTNVLECYKKEEEC